MVYQKVETLKKFMDREGVEAKFYEFSESTLSVEDSASQLKVDPSRIVKSLVFKDSRNNPLLVIVSGVKKADEEKLSDVYGSKISMAKAREVEEFTGYKIGEVPPICSGLKTFLDSEILEFESVFAGGGSTHTLMELDPRDIVRVANATLAEISR